MKKLLTLLSFLLFFNPVKAQDNFPYNQELNLKYGIEGTLIEKQAEGELKKIDHSIYGIAKIPLKSRFLPDITMSFILNYESNITFEDGELKTIPVGYMSLLEGLFHYMNYIHNVETPRDTSLYYLFVTNQKKDIFVIHEEDTTKSLELRVRVSPKNKNEKLIKNSIASINEVIVYFEKETGIPTEAHATAYVLKIFPIEAHAYLKQ